MFVDFSETEKFLRNCKDAVIITHRSPDGDCIGAGFGLKDILSLLKTVQERISSRSPLSL